MIPRRSLGATVRGPVVTAVAVILTFVAGGTTWSALAPLTSAAIAPGFVGVESRKKTLQHLEGGIVKEILVREGDRVAAGDLLIRLDDTVARSTFNLLEGQFIDQYVLRRRLVAEQSGDPDMTIGERLPPVRDKARLERSYAMQAEVFRNRRFAIESRTRLIRGQIERLRQQVAGFEAEMVQLQIQRDLIGQEEKAVAKIVRQGLERNSRLYATQRAAAGIDGQLARLRGRIAEAEISISQAELEINDLLTSFRNQVTGELANLSNAMADMEPRLIAARNKLDRTEIFAPVSGTVLSLSHHTIGGVIAPGQAILDLVPADSNLLIEAQIGPSEIDVVRPGLDAEVRLTAFSARTTPTLPGKVVLVSGDRLWDEAARSYYYAIRVRLSVEDLDQTHPVNLDELYPGMPVDVMVITGQKTVLDYFLQPITDAMSRAFRE